MLRNINTRVLSSRRLFWLGEEVDKIYIHLPAHTIVNPSTHQIFIHTRQESHTHPSHVQRQSVSESYTRQAASERVRVSRTTREGEEGIKYRYQIGHGPLLNCAPCFPPRLSCRIFRSIRKAELPLTGERPSNVGEALYLPDSVFCVMLLLSAFSLYLPFS